MIDYDKHRAAIEQHYTDRCTISRVQEREKPSGETVQEFGPLYTDQPCRLSQKALAVNDQTEAQNNIAYETKLFIAPELGIMQGDKIEIVRGLESPEGWKAIAPAKTYESGEPFFYPTHQEAILQRKEWA
ncbi:DUF6093 family protein [Paenibacillus chitinolyticus]